MPRFRTTIATLLLLILAAPSSAQPPPAQQKSKGRKDSPQRAPRAGIEADAVAAQRRATAIYALTSLASDARAFADEELRARVQARIADALWASDEDVARELFRRAWASAAIADKDALSRLKAESAAQTFQYGSSEYLPPTQLRREVLELAALRDRTLAEEFLAELGTGVTSVPGKTSTDRCPPPSQDMAALLAENIRLDLATSLLAGGEPARALQFSDPLLDSVTVSAMTFLSALRAQAREEADRRYSLLLSRAAADPCSDANTASLLTSYTFTPFTYYTANGRGMIAVSRMRGDTTVPDIGPALTESILQAAAAMLLRPGTPEGYDQTTAGRAGTYFIVRHLMPLYEGRDQRTVQKLSALSDDLRPYVPERARRLAEGEAAARSRVGDEFDEAERRAERAASPADREAIYAEAAGSAAWRGDRRVTDLIEKVSDPSLRSAIRGIAGFAGVRRALDRKDADGAARLARAADLNPLQRVWALTQAAKLLSGSDRVGALVLLGDAGAAARRIGGGDADRPRALLAVANGYAQLDRPRAWEELEEAVKAANSTNVFTGEGGRLVFQLRLKRRLWTKGVAAPEFDLGSLLTVLAGVDFDRAVYLANSLKGGAARAVATIAVARSVLAKHSASDGNKGDTRKAGRSGAGT